MKYYIAIEGQTFGISSDRELLPWELLGWLIETTETVNGGKVKGSVPYKFKRVSS